MVKTVSPIFRKLFQTVQDPVLILNTSCQIESINDCAAQLLNINMKQNKQLLLDEQSEVRWSDFVNRIRKDMGGFCLLRIRVNEVQYKEIKLAGYYHEEKNLIFARIDLVKEARKDESISSTAFSMIDDVTHGLIFTNIDGEIVEMNELAEKYINCEKNALIYERYERIFDNLIDYEFSKLKFMEKLLNNGRASLNVESHLANGEALFLKLESRFNYKLGLIVTTITDETELVTLKRQLEQQNSLNAIGEMAASLAHEIRNPMTSLKGFIELLKMTSADDSKKYLNVMDSELHRMESILSDLLYLSKPKQRSFEILSINQVVEEVVELMQPHAIQHNINLTMKCYDPYTAKIFGNENRLKQMLINLVKNAIEVMPNGGTIRVCIEYTDEGVLLAIQDEGQGIAETELNKLFTPFYTTKEAGTGLGLVLVKKVVEEHNGSVTVESVVGKGTTFKITMPFCEQSFCSEYKDGRSNYWFENDSRKRLPVV